MPDCEQVRVELVPYISGEASKETTSFVERHLDSCPDCRMELEELRVTAALVKTSPAELAPPQHLERRTFELIEQQSREAPARGETIDAPIPIESAPKPQRRRIRQTVRKPRGASSDRPRLVAMLAPGIAAALVILGFVGVRLYQDNQDLRRELTRQEDAFGSLGEKLDTVTLTSAEDSEMRLVADIYEQDTDNYQLVLDAQNFPPCPDDYQYELWFQGEEGWVSAGSFKTTGDDNMTFRLHAALDPSEFPAMDLTLERIDGKPGRTAPAVMHSAIPGGSL
jgi:Anti-sigma-K factor rskA/Putative zinc-finger